MEMIRTKQPASGQIQAKEDANSTPPVKDNPIPVYPKYYHHWGGHLPFPPKDCPCSKYSFIREGIRWLDIAFCSMNKCGQAPCKRRKSYTKDEWESESRRLENMRRETRGKK